MPLIAKIAWLHLANGRILSTRSRGKDCYYLPGGKREPGETDRQTLLREIWEELSIALDPASVEFARTFEAPAHGHPAGVLRRMSCYRARHAGELQPAAEIAEVVWLTYRDRPQVSAADQLIVDWLREQRPLID